MSLAGIQAIPITPVEPAFEIREEENHVHLIFRETLHVSDHIRITEHISTFDPLLPLWERINQSNNVIADGLEWLYLGKIASNDRTAFLAYWIALELLVEHIPGNERATTVLQHYVPAEKHALLKVEMEQVLKKYIADDAARDRLIKYLRQAKLESNIDRWTRILKESGVDVHPGEVQQFVRTRGAIVHSSNKSNTVVPSPRLREVVTTYLNVLLHSEEEKEILSGLDASS